jgi:hypothetical protein
MKDKAWQLNYCAFSMMIQAAAVTNFSASSHL